MTEQELMKEFKYNGCDISAYTGRVETVNTNESKFIDGRKTAIATTRTFSCTNLLVFSKNFAYLAHMFPSEVVGLNNDLDNRINELIEIINHFNPDEINVIISLGESVPSFGKKDFHNLEHLHQKLNILKEYCENLQIELNLFPIMKSKYLLFDLDKYLLYINNHNKEIIDINKTTNIKKLTSINIGKSK